MRPSDVLPILGAVLVTISLTTRAASAETIYDGGRALGNGSARVYMEFEADGKLQALGVSFEEAMLEGLPRVPNTYSRCFDKNGNGRIDARGECNGDYELIFLLPDELTSRTDAPFRWIGVNWNPAGHPHPAPPPWAVPHFDFHFYIQEREAVRAIRAGKCSELIDCGDFERAQKPVPAKYRHRDHIDVGAAVPDMGNHLIDSKSPELAKNGPPFTHTFIFGAFDGHITFYEPMITRAYLAGRPTMCADLKMPRVWEIAGSYPTKYCIRYHGDDSRYTVSLESFHFRSEN